MNKFDILTATVVPGHPSKGRVIDLQEEFDNPEYCDVCLEPLQKGQKLVSIPLGPVDEKAKMLRDHGKPYTACCALIHEECSTKEWK